MTAAQDILEVVQKNPGVLQMNIVDMIETKNPTSIQKAIKGLIGWGRITRRRVPILKGHGGTTFQLEICGCEENGKNRNK